MSASNPPPPYMVVNKRLLGFLIWQFIPSTLVFLFIKIFISTISSSNISSTKPQFKFPFFLPSVTNMITFFTFHFSQVLFSRALSLIASPEPHRPASPLDLSLGIFRFLLVSGGRDVSASRDFRYRARVSLGLGLFLASAAISGLVAAVSVCIGGFDNGYLLMARQGFRGVLMGLLYGLHYVYNRRWVLEFPIIQRSPYFSYKMQLPLAAKQAFKLSSLGYLLTATLVFFLPAQLKSDLTVRKFFAEQIIFYLGSFAVFLSWESSHHLYQVIQTRRFTFAPPRGSAAAETNPTEPLLASLEDSYPNSLLQYLAYLDLCMVSENNVDTWRRAAFFEESGETYKRVIAVCLRPLGQLAFELCKSVENPTDRNSQIALQLRLPTESQSDQNCYEPLNNFQLVTWSARTVAALTALSHQEDTFGVAQLSGSNAEVISTLISCLLAVETFMGKNTIVQSSHNLMGPAGIKWATSSIGRADMVVRKKRGGPVYSKAYALADALRTSIYSVVSAFHDEMLASAKAGNLEKDWIASNKPLFGSCELLGKKLRLFMDFQVS